MIGWEMFEHLGLPLQSIEQNLLPFGGVSLVAVGNFFQFPPVNQKTLFVKASKGSYSSYNGWLLEEFWLHELV